jgi:putative polyketide hydroxylase
LYFLFTYASVIGMRSDEISPVLVVGGSLVGLSAAVFLAHQGVPVVLVEKHAGSSAHPRAIGYTTRTLELFRAAGIQLPTSAQGQRPPRRARVESLAGSWFSEQPWTTQVEQPRYEYSPERATAIAQDRLEPILRSRAVALGAELRASTEATDVAQDDDGVTVTLRPQQGDIYRMRTQYVVAADGANSPIREALGIARGGQGLLSIQRSILFRAPIDHFLEHGVVQFEIEQPDLAAFLTTYSDGRWVLMLSDDVDRDPDQQRAVVRQAVGLTDLPVELLTTGRWELAALIAERFRAGRVFLVGDAAHQLPPNRGGYGANTGIEDAHNLAWKLAAVLRGEAQPALLDTYDAERRPIAWLRHDQIFARADYKAHLDGPGSEVDVIDDVAMELGQLYRSSSVLGTSEQLPPALRPDQWAGQPGTRAPYMMLRLADGQTTSTLDVFGRDWVLLSQRNSWRNAASAAAGQLGIGVIFVHVDSAKVLVPLGSRSFQNAYGVTPDGASLVRPDGYIAARWNTTPADPACVLTEALRRVAAPARAAQTFGRAP